MLGLSRGAARLKGISEEVLRAVRSHLPPEVQLLDLLMGLAGRCPPYPLNCAHLSGSTIMKGKI